MKKQAVGFFIGRFQPGLHLGHIDGIKQAIENGVRDFLIGIGSSNKEFTKENPFTYDERKTMVEMSLKDFPGMSYQIFPIPDFPTDEERKNYILQILPHFDCVVTGNPWVREIFEKDDKEIIRLKMRVLVSGTLLREQLTLEKITELNNSLPSSVVDYLKTIKAEQRLMELSHT